MQFNELIRLKNVEDLNFHWLSEKEKEKVHTSQYTRRMAGRLEPSEPFEQAASVV